MSTRASVARMYPAAIPVIVGRPAQYESQRAECLDPVLMRYRVAVPEDRRDEVERVHGFHARSCPVARSLEGGIDVRTELAFS
jgi:hypothetical protein